MFRLRNVCTFFNTMVDLFLKICIIVKGYTGDKTPVYLAQFTDEEMFI